MISALYAKIISFVTYFYTSPIASPTSRTANAISHAIRHCTNTVINAAPLPPISRFTVAIAATQGVYNKVNTRKTIAPKGVNKVGNADTSPPSRTVSVETTLSFAVKPVMSAVAIR